MTRCNLAATPPGRKPDRVFRGGDLQVKTATMEILPDGKSRPQIQVLNPRPSTRVE